MYILRDIAMVLMAALLAGLLFWRLRQPLILGYVFAGLVLSPLTPGPHVHDIHTFEVMAEVGVILLMFSVGIEFSIPELLRVKWVALIGAPIGISLLIGLGVAAGTLLGWPLLQSVACGSIICVASTMVLSRLLMDRGELSSETGRVMFTITLVDDMAVIILTVVLPALGSEGGGPWAALWTIGKAFLFLAPVVFIAWKVMPGIAARVTKTCNEEITVLLALTTCLVIAAFTEAVGLSLALGAFVAGLLIGNSGHAHQLEAKTTPIRDVFVAVFFVTIGMLIDLRTIFSNWRILAVVVALIVVGKFAVWFTVVRLFGYPARTALRVGIGLTQIGELSFVLAQVALQSRLISADVYNATLAASLITILINAALFGLLKPLPSGPSREQEAPGNAYAAPSRA